MIKMIPKSIYQIILILNFLFIKSSLVFGYNLNIEDIKMSVPDDINILLNLKDYQKYYSMY